MRWNGYLLTSGVNLDTAVRSIRRTRFPIRVQNLAICDRDLWPFDLEQLSYMAGHVTNLATVYEDLMPICSWVMSYNVSHWLPLKMRTRLLGMRRITWPVSRGSKTITFLECSTPIYLFTRGLYNFYWAPTTIKGRLLSSRPMLKPFSGKKIVPSKWGPKMAVLGENGV